MKEALKGIIGRLKGIKSVPGNGLALFSGEGGYYV